MALHPARDEGRYGRQTPVAVWPRSCLHVVPMPQPGMLSIRSHAAAQIDVPGGLSTLAQMKPSAQSPWVMQAAPCMPPPVAAQMPFSISGAYCEGGEEPWPANVQSWSRREQ